MQIYLVFYTYHLSLSKNEPFPSQKLELKPLIIIVDGKYKFYINNILDLKINKQ